MREMRLVLLFFLFIVLGRLSAQTTSYLELIEEGRGEVTIGYHNFSDAPNESNEHSFEHDIMELFFRYIEEKKDVRIKRNYVENPSFKGLFRAVEHHNLDFAYCFFSITEERKQVVNFSPPYMPNVEVLISNKSLPVVIDSNEFRLKFKNATALYIPQTTYEENIIALKNKFPEIKTKKIASSTELLQAVNDNPNYFGYVELQQYFDFKHQLKNINRQNIFLIKREGYGFIYPKPSDWKPIVDLFFIEKADEISAIIRKRFDGEMIRFIDNIKGTETADMSLLLLTKEKELIELKSKTNKILYDNEKIENQRAKAAEETMKKYLILFGILFFIIIVVIFIAYRIKVKHNREILLKNKELAIQKAIVDKKHKEIKDSINYAKRIQNALLQSEEHENKDLPEHFIFFQPKDIVSGDFYWSKSFEKHYYLSVTDCTGHGVPGGFMSVLGIAMLNEITRAKKNIDPSDILDTLREKVITELDQSNDTDSSRDGMNSALLKVNKETLMMHYAGAYHSIVIVRDKELIELKTDKEPIGFTYIMTPFNNKQFQLQKGDMLYMYSDGYPDQFGGEKNKKFKSRKLKELLLKVSHLSLIEQKRILTKTFNDWKGDEEQIDDVTVLGVRL